MCDGVLQCLFCFYCFSGVPAMAINVSVQYNVGLPPRHHTVDPMLFPLRNPFKCHEEVLYLQPLIPPKRLDISPSLTGGCSEGLGAF